MGHLGKPLRRIEPLKLPEKEPVTPAPKKEPEKVPAKTCR